MKNKFTSQKGLAPIVIILIVIVVLAAGGGYYYWQKSKVPGQKACTQEVKQCPDGSYVSRTGPNCEFSPCPEAKAGETADWKTYRNEKYGFEVKYPVNYNAEQPTPDTDVFIIRIPQKQEYLQIQVLNTKPPPVENYRPNSAQLIGEVMIGGKKAIKYYTENPLGEGALSGYPFTNYTIVLGDNKWININYYGKGSVVESFEKVLSTFKFIEKTDTANWKTYRNEEYNYIVKYPADWKPAISLTNTSDRPEYVIRQSVNLSENIWISVWENLSNLQLSQWFDKYGRPLVDKNAEITNRIATIDSLLAICAKNLQSPQAFEMQECYFQKGNYIYRINYSNDDGGKSLGTFNQILSTFKFIK